MLICKVSTMRICVICFNDTFFDTFGDIVPSLNALTPAVNLPPVSMTPAAICQR
jgi:hypothetical protein